MSDKKRVPIYQTRTRTGAVRQQVAPARAALKPGDDAKAASATWFVAADSLAGVEPKPGDRCCGTDGVWWVVKEVAPLADGVYPCLCDREGGGDK